MAITCKATARRNLSGCLAFQFFLEYNIDGNEKRDGQQPSAAISTTKKIAASLKAVTNA